MNSMAQNSFLSYCNVEEDLVRYDTFSYCSDKLSSDHEDIVVEMMILMSKLGILLPLISVEFHGSDGYGKHFIRRVT